MAPRPRASTPSPRAALLLLPALLALLLAINTTLPSTALAAPLPISLGRGHPRYFARRATAATATAADSLAASTGAYGHGYGYDPSVNPPGLLFDDPDTATSRADTATSRANSPAQSAAGSFDGNRVTEEVTRPIERPSGVTPCTVPIMTERNFSQFFDPVLITYSPPSGAGCSGPWQLVVVAMNARLNGVNFDRRFTFYLGGIPLLVTTTAQYRTPGMNFSSERDLTLYSAFLLESQTGVIELPNPTDSTYTGVYTVSVELQFYPGTPAQLLPDVVIPAPGPSFTAPRNVYQAKVEIYVSHFQSDEFYYLSTPPKYFNSLSPIEQSVVFANSTAFREVVVRLDGTAVGVVFPKPLLYSGALDPQAWKGFMGIGSLFMPTYTLDVTPFVARMIDGEAHSLTVDVRYASRDSLWVAAGALFLWRDPVRSRTRGRVRFSQLRGPKLSEQISDFKTLDTQITTTASRQFAASGVVRSSFGRITTSVTSSLRFRNRLVMERDASAISVQHLSTMSTTVQRTEEQAGVLSLERHDLAFPFDVSLDYNYLPENSILEFPSISYYVRFSHAINSATSFVTPLSQRSSTLSNSQDISSFQNTDYPGSYLLSGTHNYNLTGTDGCYTRLVKTVINPTVFSTYHPQVLLDGIVDSCPS